MRKHRRTRHYRKISIAAGVIAAVGVPTAAMACVGGASAADGWSRPWQNASADDQSRHWQKTSTDDRSRHWQKKSTDDRSSRSEWTRKPAGGASQTPSASPTPSTSATAAPATGAVARVVELVNSERSQAGCAPLKVNEKLTKAAQDHSEDMAAHRNMSHTGSDGSNPGNRIKRAGYDWASYGENVAYGYRTPESVMDGWMSSPGHKRNILDCKFKEIGVGLAQPGYYWTQNFGTAR